MNRAIFSVTSTPSFCSFLEHYGFSGSFVFSDPLFSSYIYTKTCMFWISCHHLLDCPVFLKLFSSNNFLHRAPTASNLTPCPTFRHHFEWARLPSSAEPYAWIQAPFASIKAILSCCPSSKIPLRDYKNKGWNSGSAEVNGNIATDFNKARTDLSTRSSSTRLCVSHRRIRRVSALPLLKIIHRFSVRTPSISFTLSEDIRIDKLTDQTRRNMPDLKYLAKYRKFGPVNCQVETILSEKMTMLETAPALDSSRN